MPNIYCFTGLGANERLFEHIAVPPFSLQHIKWLPPAAAETLPLYAKRLTAQINEPNPILLGVSFGGMLAVEAAKYLDARHTILISSVCTASHLPTYYHLASKLQLLRWAPIHLFTKAGALNNYFFGAANKEDKDLLRYFMQQVDPSYIKWALQAIINWKATNSPANMTHIHGTKDRIIPLPKTTQHIIKGGGHMMVYNRAVAINKLLQNLLTPQD